MPSYAEGLGNSRSEGAPLESLSRVSSLDELHAAAGKLEGRFAVHRKLDAEEAASRAGKTRAALAQELFSNPRFLAGQASLTGVNPGRFELNIRQAYLLEIHRSLVGGSPDSNLIVYEARVAGGNSPICHPDFPQSKLLPDTALVVMGSDRSVRTIRLDSLDLAGCDDIATELLLSQGLFLKIGETHRPFPQRSLSSAFELRDSALRSQPNFHPSIEAFKLVLALLRRFETQDKIRSLDLSKDEHTELAFLSETELLSTSTALPRVRHQYVTMLDRVAYSLFQDETLVMQHLGGQQFAAAISSSKAKPFEIVSVLLSPSPFALEQTKRSLGLAIGDIVTSDGYRLFGEAEARARSLYDNLRSGTRIFPADSDSGFRILRDAPEPRESAPRAPVSPRDWGQRFLLSLEPQTVVSGEVFPADPIGRAYKAFIYPDYVICESSHTGNATYVIARTHWETLRQWSRQDLTRHRPSGFIQRVFHGRDEPAFHLHWQDEVSPYAYSGRDPGAARARVAS